MKGNEIVALCRLLFHIRDRVAMVILYLDKVSVITATKGKPARVLNHRWRDLTMDELHRTSSLFSHSWLDRVGTDVAAVRNNNKPKRTYTSPLESSRLGSGGMGSLERPSDVVFRVDFLQCRTVRYGAPGSFPGLRNMRDALSCLSLLCPALDRTGQDRACCILSYSSIVMLVV